MMLTWRVALEAEIQIYHAQSETDCTFEDESPMLHLLFNVIMHFDWIVSMELINVAAISQQEFQ